MPCLTHSKTARGLHRIGDGHSSRLNTAALKLAKIDATTKDAAGGIIDRHAGNNPTGLLRENGRRRASRI